MTNDLFPLSSMSGKLILLHGAIGASAQLVPFQKLLRKPFKPLVFDFPGHGGKRFPKAKFSIPFFAESTLKMMDKKKIAVGDFFGYSMGGYVALYLARHYPERVGKVMTLATKFSWDPETAQREVKMLDPEKITEKVPAFAKELEELHAPADWKEVLRRTAGMMLALGNDPVLTADDFSQIEKPVLLCLGDRDKMVSLQETISVYRSLPRAQLAVLPETPHPFAQVDLQKLLPVTRQFFAE
jgi:pimeloyl-ACP methyl ester carboxylesterase